MPTDVDVVAGVIRAVAVLLLSILPPAVLWLWRKVQGLYPRVPEAPHEWAPGKWNNACAWVWRNWKSKGLADLDEAIAEYFAYVVDRQKAEQAGPRTAPKAEEEPIPARAQLKKALRQRHIDLDRHPSPDDEEGLARFARKRFACIILFVVGVALSLSAILFAVGVVFGLVD